MADGITDTDNHELVLERVIDLPREKLFRVWTEPNLLKEWFAPKPWSIALVDIDPVTGGKNHFIMRDPDGNDYPNNGIYLEVVKNEKIVLTDAYTVGWQPATRPFFTAIITFEDIGDGKTRYRAIARHWREADKKKHEEMGFHEGWGICADQMEQLAASL